MSLLSAQWLAGGLLACWLMLLALVLVQLVRQLRQAQPLPDVSLAPAQAALPNWVPITGSLSLCALLVLMLLESAWLDQVGPYTIAGYLPWSDASGWLHGSFRLLHDGRLDDWVVRRPLNVVFWVGQALLTGSDYFLMLLTRVLLLAIALVILLLEYGRVAGAWGGLFGVLLIPLFAAPFVAAALSEATGITYAALAFALLLRGVRRQALWSYVFGAMLLAVALSIRMGPVLVLAGIVLWPVVAQQKPWRCRWQWSAATLLGIVAGIGLSWLWMVLAYPGGNSIGANYAYTWYGLVHGGADWKLFYEHYPQIGVLSEAEQTRMAYSSGWRHVQEAPQDLLAGLLAFATRYWGDLFVWAPVPLRHFLLVPFAIGAARLCWSWRQPFASFVILGWLGAMATSPILYWSVDAMRVYIVTAPLDCLIVAVGVGAVLRFLGERQPPTVQFADRGVVPITFGLILLSLLTLVPVIAVQSARQAVPEFTACPNDSRASVHELGNSSPYVLGQSGDWHWRDAAIDRWEDTLDDAVFPLNRALKVLEAGDFLIHGYDFSDPTAPAFLIADAEILNMDPGWVGLCSEQLVYRRHGEPDYSFYRVHKAVRLTTPVL
ncbi:MAG: hypothetical protein ACR2PZ_22260 [Pseudomonadales bacterium]